MEMTLLTKQQKTRAAQVFYRSFFNYPQMVCYFPDEQVRVKHLEWYLGCVIDYSLRYGEVHTNPEISAFACWLPPEKTAPDNWGYIQSGLLMAPLRFGIQKYMRVIECEDYAASIHKKLMLNPHYYVWGVGVDPNQQGKGLGSQILKPGLDRAQHKRLPVYLETHDAKNIRFYEKLGFKLVHEDKVPKYDLPFWCFIREPQPED